MTVDLKDIKKPEPSNGFKLLQYGMSGAGKTQRMLSALKYGPMFILDTDNKYNNFADAVLTPQERGQIVAVNPKSLQEIFDVFTKLQKLGANIPFATVCIDTFSRLNEVALEHVHKENGGKMNIPGWTELKRLLSGFFKQGVFPLPSNVIVNAHAAEKENALKELEITIGGDGKSGAMLPELVDECHYLYIKRPDNKHIVQGKGSGVILAKTLFKDHLEGLNFKTSDLSIFEKVAITRPALDKSYKF